MLKAARPTYQARKLQPGQRFIVLFLAVAVFFNISTTYAMPISSMDHHAMTGMMMDMSDSATACQYQSEQQNKPCTKVNQHGCMMHCASFVMLISEAQPIFQQTNLSTKPNFHIDTMPLEYTRPPLLRPPRS